MQGGRGYARRQRSGAAAAGPSSSSLAAQINARSSAALPAPEQLPSRTTPSPGPRPGSPLSCPACASPPHPTATSPADTSAALQAVDGESCPVGQNQDAEVARHCPSAEPGGTGAMSMAPGALLVGSPAALDGGSAAAAQHARVAPDSAAEEAGGGSPSGGGGTDSGAGPSNPRLADLLAVLGSTMPAWKVGPAPTAQLLSACCLCHLHHCTSFQHAPPCCAGSSLQL